MIDGHKTDITGIIDRHKTDTTGMRADGEGVYAGVLGTRSQIDTNRARTDGQRSKGDG